MKVFVRCEEEWWPIYELSKQAQSGRSGQFIDMTAAEFANYRRVKGEFDQIQEMIWDRLRWVDEPARIAVLEGADFVPGVYVFEDDDVREHDEV